MSARIGLLHFMTAAMAAGILSGTPAWARDQTMTLMFPYPDGYQCAIELATPLEGAAGLADLNKLSAALKRAFDGSQDMRDKVKEACQKWNGSIQIWVYRDEPRVTEAGALPNTNQILVDVGDVEQTANFLTTNEQKIKDAYAGLHLISSLAHELEHLKDGPGEKAHEDPPTGCRGDQTGPAVDDQNKVLEELGSLLVRTNYSNEKTGMISYRYGGVTFDLDFVAHARQSRRVKATPPAPAPQSQGPPAPPMRHSMPLDSIPDEPCPVKDGACYPVPSIPTGTSCGGSRFTFTDPKVYGTLGGAALGGLLIAGGGGGAPATAAMPTVAVPQPPVQPPTASQPAPQPPATQPEPPPSNPPPAPPPAVGNPQGTHVVTNCSVVDDAAVHDPTFMFCRRVVQMSISVAAPGIMGVGGVAPLLPLSGAFSTTAGSFDLSTTGTIVGFPNTSERMTGVIDVNGNLNNTLIVFGANGSLPAGRSITYRITTSRQP